MFPQAVRRVSVTDRDIRMNPTAPNGLGCPARGGPVLFYRTPLRRDAHTAAAIGRPFFAGILMPRNNNGASDLFEVAFRGR